MSLSPPVSMSNEERAAGARRSHSEFADQINRRLARRYAALTVLVPVATVLSVVMVVRTWHPRFALALTGSLVLFLVVTGIARAILVAPFRRRLTESLDTYCREHGIEAADVCAATSDDARFIRSLLPSTPIPLDD